MPWWGWLLAILAALLVLGILAGRDPLVRAFAERLEALGWRRSLRGIWNLMRDPRAPVLPRLVVLPLILSLAMPIDLVPDFIPVLGYLDDLLLVGLTAWLMLRLTPAAIVDHHFPPGDGFSPGDGRDEHHAGI